MRKKQLSSALSSVVLTVVILGILALVTWWVIIPRVSELPFIQALRPNRVTADFREQMNLDPFTPLIVFNDEIIRDVTPRIENITTNPMVILSHSFLRDYIDPFIFMDTAAGTLFISTQTDLLEFTNGSNSFRQNGQTRGLMTPINIIGEVVHLPIDLIQSLYPWIIEYNRDTNMIIITETHVPHTTANVSSSRADVRFSGNSRSPIIEVLASGDRVFKFPDAEVPEVGFVRVRTSNGIIGYMLESELTNTATARQTSPVSPLLGSFINNRAPVTPNWPANVHVNMVWEQINSPGQNGNMMNVDVHPSVNVLSPTWFSLDPAGTHINSLALQEYVNWAQQQGIQVWPKVFDVNNATVRAMLMSRANRHNVVSQIVSFVDSMGLDGINIDFEHLMTSSEGPYKIQFLRELAIPLRERGVTLSAAVLIPIPTNMFYRRDLIALTVDFVQLMAYDEHYATSAVMGPNASLPWVQNAVENTLREVPANQLILGLPFYSRMWREVPLSGTHTQRAAGMNITRQFFEDNGVEWEWNEELAVYFGEITVVEEGETVTWRVWLEDERSIRAKMQVFAAFDLAGVAAWSRGLENPQTWEAIAHFIN